MQTNRRKFVKAGFASVAGALLTGRALTSCEPSELRLDSDFMGMLFDSRTGTLEAIENKLTGEIYKIAGDTFAVDADEFMIGFDEVRISTIKKEGSKIIASYRSEEMTIDVTYMLGGKNHFAEKKIILRCDRAYGLRKVILSHSTFSASGLRLFPYRYPKFGREPGEEPCLTLFGRTSKGGIFAGVEMPFDASFNEGLEAVFAYSPGLKVREDEEITCEPLYFGVYARNEGEEEKKGKAFRLPSSTLKPGQVEEDEDLPLLSESEAMVNMVSSVLGPPRFGLVPMANGWHSEMEKYTYTEDSLKGDMKSLDFIKECGIDWVGDSHPWGGETEKMNTLGPDEKYDPGPLVRRFLNHADELGIKVCMWTTMNNTHPWTFGRLPEGMPFRHGEPELLLQPGESVKGADTPKFLRNSRGNCIANKSFLDWLIRINHDGMDAGKYQAWAVDGDFFGTGGWYTSVIPVDCMSDQHDHLPGDSNYASQQALRYLITSIRSQFPEAYIFVMRPPMDLGVWALHNVDTCFTLLESGTGTDNLAAGDNIRTWSRVRVHRDFFPHYLDQPLLFPSREHYLSRSTVWPEGNIDYIMLSALSSSPNQLFYLPTKTDIPRKDKKEIRKWLDWGRKNIAYIKVRKDLPEWPGSGRVDGSAHLIGRRGLVFLFNSGDSFLEYSFLLTEQHIGLKEEGDIQIRQEYPMSDKVINATFGEAVSWEVPARTAIILRTGPA